MNKSCNYFSDEGLMEKAENVKSFNKMISLITILAVAGIWFKFVFILEESIKIAVVH